MRVGSFEVDVHWQTEGHSQLVTGGGTSSVEDVSAIAPLSHFPEMIDAYPRLEPILSVLWEEDCGCCLRLRALKSFRRSRIEVEIRISQCGRELPQGSREVLACQKSTHFHMQLESALSSTIKEEGGSCSQFTFRHQSLS